MGKRYGNYRLQDAVLPPIRMYSEELESIRKAAKAADQTVADWVRGKLLEPQVPQKEKDVPDFVIDLQPKQKQSVTPIVKERTRTPRPKTAKEKTKETSAKKDHCPHGFIRLDDGTTSCTQCTESA